MLDFHTSVVPYSVFLLSFRKRLLSPVGRNVLHLQVMAQRTACLQTPLQCQCPLPINHDVADPLKTLRVLPHQIKRLELRQGQGLGGAGREQHLLRIPPPQPQLIQSVSRHQNSRKKQSPKERGRRDRLTCKGNWIIEITCSFTGN